jgi:hypothetical protein
LAEANGNALPCLSQDIHEQKEGNGMVSLGDALISRSLTGCGDRDARGSADLPASNLAVLPVRDRGDTPSAQIPGAALELLRSMLRSKGPVGSEWLSLLRRTLQAVGSETVVLSVLRPRLVRRYFAFLEGKSADKPYYFPNEVRDEHLGVYVHFELCHDDPDYQRESVLEFMREPLLEGRNAKDRVCDFELGCNLAVSHLRAKPLSFARLLMTIDREEMRRFLRCVDSAANRSVNRAFAHIFCAERVALVEEYARGRLSGRHITATNARRRLAELDRRFFSEDS